MIEARVYPPELWPYQGDLADPRWCVQLGVELHIVENNGATRCLGGWDFEFLLLVDGTLVFATVRHRIRIVRHGHSE